MKNLRQYLPQLDLLLQKAEKAGIHSPRLLVKIALKQLLAKQRNALLGEQFSPTADIFSDKNFMPALEAEMQRLKTPAFKRVINATGTIIHTNLGRAPLSKEILEEIEPFLCGYSDLEINMLTAKRSSRQDLLSPRLFSSESILVVNNNAAACYLVLSTLAQGKEVIVSRGELVEIGGSFRIPDIMQSSGAILREVGTTNRTRLRDYEKAINQKTGLLLKVHRSNFIQKGFTEEVSTEDLAGLSKKTRIPLYYDSGSGGLSAIRSICIGEPITEEEIKRGVSILSFSGDKLLGGVQAGIILGKKKYLDAMKKNPAYRMLRPDKITLYYLERLLFYLLSGDYDKSPVMSMLMEDENSVRERAVKLYSLLKKLVPEDHIFLTPDKSAPGGGTLPEVYINTHVVKLKHPAYKSEEINKKLRTNEPSILARQKDGFCIIDLRTVREDELEVLLTAITGLFTRREAVL